MKRSRRVLFAAAALAAVAALAVAAAVASRTICRDDGRGRLVEAERNGGEIGQYLEA